MVERPVDYQSMECSAYLHPDRIKENPDIGSTVITKQKKRVSWLG
jgi:hypothetical protein